MFVCLVAGGGFLLLFLYFHLMLGIHLRVIELKPLMCDCFFFSGILLDEYKDDRRI